VEIGEKLGRLTVSPVSRIMAAFKVWQQFVQKSVEKNTIRPL
jgi:hypothetical protein